MSEHLLELRRDYDRLLLSFRESENMHLATQTSYKREIALLKDDISNLHEQLQHMRQQSEALDKLAGLLQAQLQEKDKALDFAFSRCQTAESSLKRVEVQLQSHPNNSRLTRKNQLEKALQQACRKIQTLTELAASWKDKFQMIQGKSVRSSSKCTSSQRPHPLVLRMREMVRDCRGESDLPSAKESWGWVKKVVQVYMHKRKHKF